VGGVLEQQRWAGHKRLQSCRTASTEFNYQPTAQNEQTKKLSHLLVLSKGLSPAHVLALWRIVPGHLLSSNVVRPDWRINGRVQLDRRVDLVDSRHAC